MAYDSKSLDDYIDVAERIAAFYEKYPDGSLQPADPLHPWEQVMIEGRDKDGKPNAQTFVLYTACAYRTPQDARPGVGCAWEVFPGRTPYTRGSEMMNAETSAWGRAIAALGIATRKGIASRQEVDQARQRQDGLPANADGSLSRSRTTDAEKDAAGVMTSGQQAEHTALQPKRADQRAPAGRAATSGADEWATTAGLEDKPGTISPQQRNAMHAAFATAGINDRAARLAKTAEVIGREVKSSNDLSYAEAGRLLEYLHGFTAAGVRPA